MRNIKKIRLEFHKIPELAFTEKETTKLILSYLNNIPSFDSYANVFKTGDSGLIVTIPKDTLKHYIAFRADIDGLPIEEKSKCEVHSQHPHIMHACGHDSHITVMIAVIENIIQNIEQVIKGDFALKFIFQPAEEIGT